jgi:hypothetical protein
MTLMVPHTDLEGSYAIAQHTRSAFARLHVPRLDQKGVLRVRVSRWRCGSL